METQLLCQKGYSSSQLFGRLLLWPSGWIDQDATWHTKVGLVPSHMVLNGDPALMPPKGAQQPPLSAHVYCGQSAGWIRIPLGKLVRGRFLPRRHCVQWEPSSPTERGTAAPPPLFGPCLLYPNSRPSLATAELLL